MSKVRIQGDASGTGTITISAPNTNTDRTIVMPDSSGAVIVGGTPTTSTANTVTNKIPVVINGITYYLLASTSGV
jgi:hypothetical protein